MSVARTLFLVLLALTAFASPPAPDQPTDLLGLPELVIPANNPQTPAKIALGDKLFNDKRFSGDGTLSCATCHDSKKGLADGLPTSSGIRKQLGTRNAPTVLNSAYSTTMFWDGRSADLEDQAQHPFINPIEMGLKDHNPILKVVRTDAAYKKAFKEVFGKSGSQITMKEVTQAIAAFERTQISGDSPFDRYYFRGQQNALTVAQQRGFDLFVNKGRCVSCHVIEQTTALFTDNRFHNVGVGITAIQKEVPSLATEYLKAKLTLAEVDHKVLSDRRSSELGRFAISRSMEDLGSFKTPTLRNIALTAPYMHDGSLATLREVIVHYNNGGITKETDPVNDFLSSGIRPLNLTDQEIDDLVAFMEALTSHRFLPASGNARSAQ